MATWGQYGGASKRQERRMGGPATKKSDELMAFGVAVNEGR